MTRVIRYCGIGGRELKIRQRAPSGGIACACVLGAAFCLFVIAAGHGALAQQTAPCRPAELDGAVGGVLHGASGTQDLQLRACAPGTILVEQGPVPELVLAPANPEPSNNPDWGYIKTFSVQPCRLDGGSDLPGAKLTVAYQPLPRTASAATFAMTLAPDKDKPTLKTTSTPQKGTMVKPGDTIKVRMEASEEYNAARYDWQAGVKKMQLTDESRGQVVPPIWEATGDPRPCAQKHWKQTLEVTYTVPSNPPPIIRLRAIAEDFAGNKDTDLGEFPTGGDWHGSIEWWIPAPRSRVWGRLDLTVDYDGRGNLKGRMAGDSHVESPAVGVYCGMTTEAPAKISADLNGQYTPGRNTMSLGIADPQIEQGKYGVCAVGPGGGPVRVSGQWFGGSGPIGQPGFAQLLNNMTVRADGSVEASGEWPVAPAETQATLHMTLKLRKAQN